MQSSVTCLFPPMAEQAPVFSSIMAEVVFGQSSKRCVGAGICKIIPYLGHRWSRITNRPCASALGKLQMDERGLSLVFRKYALCPTLRETFLSRSHFAMDESFVFPAPLAAALWLSSDVIPAGKYPIRHQDGFLSIWLGGGDQDGR